MAERPSRIQRILVVPATLLAFQGGAVACTSKDVPQPTNTNTTASTAYDRYKNLPPGPCKRRAVMLTTPEKLQACADAQTDGEVVLVDFVGMATPAEDTLTEKIREYLTLGTSDIVTPDLTVIDASETAKTMLTQNLGTSTCIEPNQPEKFASVAADTAMPELHDYDLVVGISAVPYCNPSIDGVADAAGYGSKFRDADVYNYTEDKPEKTAKNAAHEILHLYRLGHRDQTFNQNLNYVTLYASDRIPFDLKTYFNTCSYTEYADDTNLMGSYTKDFGPPVPHPIQLDLLREIAGNPSQYAVPTGENGATIDYADNADNHYATITLDTPVPSLTEEQKNTSFDTLAIIPARDRNKGDLSGFTLVLTDTSYNQGTIIDVARLSFNEAGDNNEWMLQYGDQEIHITFHNDTLSVRSLKLTPA